MKHLLVLSFLALPFFCVANENKEKSITKENKAIATNEATEIKKSEAEVNAPQAAEATANFAELKGTVSDIYNDYSPISGVTVVLTNGDQVQKTTETDKTGRFHFDALKPGTYHITLQRKGFEPMTRKYIVLEEGRKANYGLFLFKS